MRGLQNIGVHQHHMMDSAELNITFAPNRHIAIRFNYGSSPQEVAANLRELARAIEHEDNKDEVLKVRAKMDSDVWSDDRIMDGDRITIGGSDEPFIFRPENKIMDGDRITIGGSDEPFIFRPENNFIKKYADNFLCNFQPDEMTPPIYTKELGDSFIQPKVKPRNLLDCLKENSKPTKINLK